MDQIKTVEYPEAWPNLDWHSALLGYDGEGMVDNVVGVGDELQTNED